MALPRPKSCSRRTDPELAPASWGKNRQKKYRSEHEQERVGRPDMRSAERQPSAGGSRVMWVNHRPFFFRKVGLLLGMRGLIRSR